MRPACSSPAWTARFCEVDNECPGSEACRDRRRSVGDLLGADLVKALRPLVMGKLSLVGVGGEGLEAEGLTSLFDYYELSIMGIAQVLAGLPKLVWRIRQTARAIIAARPDITVIIDSPDFTHRVARLVRKALPVCPSSTMSARVSGPGSRNARSTCGPMSIMFCGAPV